MNGIQMRHHRLLTALLVLALISLLLYVLFTPGDSPAAVERAKPEAAPPQVSETTGLVTEGRRAAAQAPRTPASPGTSSSPIAPQESGTVDPPSGRIFGYVLDRQGMPASKMDVRASCVNRGLHSNTQRFETKEDGFYEFDLPAATYRVSCFVLDRVHPLSGVTKPRVEDVELESGEEYRLDIAYGIGPCEVQGTLLDPPLLEGEEEILWEGLLVLALPVALYPSEELAGQSLNHWIALDYTDEQGRFHLEGLEPGSYRIRFAPHGYDPRSPDSRLGGPVPSYDIELTGPGAHDIGRTLAPRPRKCTIVGQITPSVAGDVLPEASQFKLTVRHPKYRYSTMHPRNTVAIRGGTLTILNACPASRRRLYVPRITPIPALEM